MKRSMIAATLVAVVGLTVGGCSNLEQRRGLAKYPACKAEDGPAPCRWDAKSQGNGIGRSFVAHADGTVEYLP